MATITFPIQEYHCFDDPAGRSNAPKTHRGYVSVNDLPSELLQWMDTNPRAQNLDSAVCKAISQSLQSKDGQFHLLNRGVLLSAERVSEKSGVLSVVMNDPECHGDIDGGHTLRIILRDRERGPLPEQFVPIEIITGLASPVELAEARNTSAAIDRRTLEELHNSYEVLKVILSGRAYSTRIEYRQNEMRGVSGKIDVRDIIGIINMFNQRIYPVDRKPFGVSNHPIGVYGAKEKNLENFLRMGLPASASREECQVLRNQVLLQMAPIIPSILDLWDLVERDLPLVNPKKYAKQRLCKIGGYRTRISGQAVSYDVPATLIYPVVGAFRALVQVDENGLYHWAAVPADIWQQCKEQIFMSVMDECETKRGNAQSIAKSTVLWNLLYNIVLVTLLKSKPALNV